MVEIIITKFANSRCVNSVFNQRFLPKLRHEKEFIEFISLSCTNTKSLSITPSKFFSQSRFSYNRWEIVLLTQPRKIGHKLNLEPLCWKLFPRNPTINSEIYCIWLKNFENYPNTTNSYISWIKSLMAIDIVMFNNISEMKDRS